MWRYPPDKIRDVKPIFVDILFGKRFFGLKYGVALSAFIIVMENIWWKYKYGGKPEWGHDFRDFWYDLHHCKPNQ